MTPRRKPIRVRTPEESGLLLADARLPASWKAQVVHRFGEAWGGETFRARSSFCGGIEAEVSSLAFTADPVTCGGCLAEIEREGPAGNLLPEPTPQPPDPPASGPPAGQLSIFDRD